MSAVAPYTGTMYRESTLVPWYHLLAARSTYHQVPGGGLLYGLFYIGTRYEQVFAGEFLHFERSSILRFFYKKLKKVSCEYDCVNG